jgi:hypothetical protein
MRIQKPEQFSPITKVGSMDEKVPDAIVWRFGSFAPRYFLPQRVSQERIFALVQ